MDLIHLPKSDEELLELCEVQTYRASGKGGQHVNKTNSAVRLIYLPHQIAITCQEGRSQYSNLQSCIEKLREKVAVLNYRQPKRVATRMSRGQKERNLDKKSKHSKKKQGRGKQISSDHF